MPAKVALASQPKSAREQFKSEMPLLYDFVEAEIYNDAYARAYITTQPITSYLTVRFSADKVLRSASEIALFKDAFNITEKQARDILANVSKKAFAEESRARAKPQKQTIKILYDYINEKLWPDPKFQKERSGRIGARVNSIIEKALSHINIALNSNELMDDIRTHFSIPLIKVREILEKIKQEILDELKDREQGKPSGMIPGSQKVKEIHVAPKPAPLFKGPWPSYPEEPE